MPVYKWKWHQIHERWDVGASKNWAFLVCWHNYRVNIIRSCHWWPFIYICALTTVNGKVQNLTTLLMDTIPIKYHQWSEQQYHYGHRTKAALY